MGFREAAWRRRWRQAGQYLLRQVGVIPPLELAEPGERLGLRNFWVDGLFLAAGSAFLGSYLSLFIIGMGATGGQIGVMTSLANLASLVGYLVAGRFMALVGGPKRAALLGARLVEVGAAALFCLLPLAVRSSLIVYVAIGLMALRAFLSALGMGAWTIFAGMVTPIRLRGRYFSSRSVIKAIMAVLVVPLSGTLIVWQGGYPTGFQLSFALALPLHLGACYMFSRIPEPPAVPAQDGYASRAANGNWRRSRRFLSFIVASAAWNLGAAVVGPFYSVFMARQLGLGADTIGLLATVATASTIAGFAFWGPLTDRQGAQWALIRTALASASLPWLWLLVRTPWHIVPIQALSGFLAGGYGIAHTNRLLEAMPQRESASAMSAHLTLHALAGIASSLAGGYLFDHSGLVGPALAGGACLWLAAGLYGLVGRSGKRPMGAAGQLTGTDAPPA